jgi:hypothetical protein
MRLQDSSLIGQVQHQSCLIKQAHRQPRKHPGSRIDRATFCQDSTFYSGYLSPRLFYVRGVRWREL